MTPKDFADWLKESGTVMSQSQVMYWGDNDPQGDLADYIAEAKFQFAQNLDLIVQTQTELAEQQAINAGLIAEGQQKFAQAEQRANLAQQKLDLQIKQDKQLMLNAVTRFMLYFISGLVLFSFAAYLYKPDDEVVKSLLSNVIISGLASGFGIIAGVTGIKQMLDKADEGK